MGQSKGRKFNYEAMFLVSPIEATDLGGVVDHLKEVMARGDVELISLKKWDERRLAFEIKKNKRCVYFLAYFGCDPVNIEVIERACNLSEKILRVLFTRADHLTLEEMKAADERMQSMLDSYVKETGKALEALKADIEGES